MSLRMRVVEAGASVITIDMDTWEEKEIAAVILDAMLDCLTENADEWVSEASGVDLDDAMERGDRKLADVLLAVLWEDR